LERNSSIPAARDCVTAVYLGWPVTAMIGSRP
jgi:hypothetical protein